MFPEPLQFKDPRVSSLYAKLTLGNDRTTQDAPPLRVPFEQSVTELVLNISEGCNLTCPYCFAGQGQYGREKSLWMAPSTVAATVSYATERFPSLQFIKLFGGEPLMNLRAIEAVVETTQRVHRESPDREITIGCVTNMTIFNKRFVEVAREAHLQVAVSIDGPQEIHDISRRFRNGRGSYERIARVLEQYRASGLMPTNIACTYTPIHVSHGLSMLNLYTFLQQEFDMSGVLLTVVNGWFSQHDTQERQFATRVRDYAEELFWMAGSTNDPRFNTLRRQILSTLLEPQPEGSWCGLGRNTITVSADGTVLPCYTLIGSGPEWIMGDKIQDSADELSLSSIADRAIAQASPAREPECQQCAIRTTCRGCPGGVFRSTGRFTGRDPSQCAYRVGAIEGFLLGRLEGASSRSSSTAPSPREVSA